MAYPCTTVINLRMKIIISDNRRIHDIQDEFHNQFPFLKIEFFSRPHRKGIGSAKRLMKSNGKSIGECRSIHSTGEIQIEPAMTVSDLEQKFAELFGLSVQVFRKSANVWLETTVTDGWTLEEQNRQGEALAGIQRKTIF